MVSVNGVVPECGPITIEQCRHRFSGALSSCQSVAVPGRVFRQLGKTWKPCFIDCPVLFDNGKKRGFVENNEKDIDRASSGGLYGLGNGVARRDG